jgi:hypothetical protein
MIWFAMCYLQARSEKKYPPEIMAITVIKVRNSEIHFSSVIRFHDVIEVAKTKPIFCCFIFMRFISAVLLVVILNALYSGTHLVPGKNLKTSLIWTDTFTPEEKQKLTSWLDGVSEAVAATFGGYPFQVNLYIHRSSGNEPVPWAETSRNGEQGVHFYVNTKYSLQDFQRDWTAAHEIAHLSIPFVGRENMWFSEGYASYWQWIILYKQGIYSSTEIEEKYKAKMDLVLPYYDTERSFIETSGKLRSKRNYPGLYWGGACYFFRVDEVLKKEHETSLGEVISAYQSDGRLDDQSLEDLVASLDRISESSVFSEMLETFQNGAAIDAVIPVAMAFD